MSCSDSLALLFISIACKLRAREPVINSTLPCCSFKHQSMYPRADINYLIDRPFLSIHPSTYRLLHRILITGSFRFPVRSEVRDVAPWSIGAVLDLVTGRF
ncbi:hypothetical protein F5Y16DRAFT_359068 [Xylariaceae sp. FL0255]|nr:hypothetical protein F5Y16DRAFT_359068 [Xylariaceae sp. FL0255]